MPLAGIGLSGERVKVYSTGLSPVISLPGDTEADKINPGVVVIEFTVVAVAVISPEEE